VIHGRSDDGFTLLEAVVALAIASAMVGASSMLLVSGDSAFRVQPEAVEMQERLRGSADQLLRELSMAGAGPDDTADSGSLLRVLAPVVPRRMGLRGDPVESVGSQAITCTYVPASFVHATTAAAGPEGGVLRLAMNPPCRMARAGCGFQAGMAVAIYDGSGLHDFFTVDAVLADSLQLRPHGSGASAVFAAGAHVVQVETHSFYFDAGRSQLREYDGLSFDAPVADDVVDLSFDYFAESAGGLTPMALSTLSDGPWRGAGQTRFDEDLLRVRAILEVLRVQSASEAFRATSGPFGRPGWSRSSRRYLADLQTTFQVRPRNLEVP
jgi:hypothetical protein